MSTYFKKGSWNAVCDVCGFVFKSHELKQRWDGMRVCKEDWEPRHPLDFQRAKGEKSPPPWTSPDDTEGTVTSIASGNVSASLIDTIYLYDPTTDISITLPAANNATFNNVSITYILSNKDTVYTVTMSSTSTIVGNTVIAAGTTARIRNVPGDNLWIRES